VIVELAGEHGYLPLAAGYMTAYALDDLAVAADATFAVVLEHCQEPPATVVAKVLAGGAPDILAVSCQGWSMPCVDVVMETVRAAHPETWIVIGGAHVSHQVTAALADRPAVDVLVNGEGEVTFHELVRRYLASVTDRPALGEVDGISYRGPDGIRTNPDRPRLKDLDQIPSPYLNGILDPYIDGAGTVMFETNRGCPYRCSFCYWGQAVGQRLHRFSRQRLVEEMEHLARRGADSWYICDANFGIGKHDSDLVDLIVDLRARYGFPRTVHCNWAKNSNERIVDLCARLHRGGVHSTYTLAMQSATPEALEIAHRSNMKINRIDELASLCRAEGVVPRGELIWGLPGENLERFYASYDELAVHTDALSVYPLYILPNTEYHERREELGIETRAVELDTDYLYCVAHLDMPFDDFLVGLRFIVANNVLKVGSTFARAFPRVVKAVAGVPFHRSIGDFAMWVAASSHPMARRFRRYVSDPLTLHRQSLTEMWVAITRDRNGVVDLFTAYVEETVCARLDREAAALVREAVRYDGLTFPIMDDERTERDLAVDGTYRSAAIFDHDILGFLRGDGGGAPRRTRVTYALTHRAGLWRYPISNWYFGLASFQAGLESVAVDDHVTLAAP